MDTTGVTGSFKIDAQGSIAEIAFVPPSEPAPRTGKRGIPRKPYFGMMSTSFRLMWPPLPEEPIGVGAKWRVTRRVPVFQTTMTEVLNVELVERTASEAVFRFDLKGTGHRRLDFPQSSQEVELRVDGQGEVTIDRNDFMPRSVALKHTTLNVVTLVDAPKPPDGNLHQTVSRSVKASRK
jgi:hypothetical protein